MGWNYRPFTNSNGAAVDVWEWINNFILQFTRRMINYAGIEVNPCWSNFGTQCITYCIVLMYVYFVSCMYFCYINFVCSLFILCFFFYNICVFYNMDLCKTLYCCSCNYTWMCLNQTTRNKKIRNDQVYYLCVRVCMCDQDETCTVQSMSKLLYS